MLDSFEILTTSGVVLWHKSYAPVGPNVINSLIKNIFIEESVAPLSDASAAQNPPYKTDKYTLKWTTVKDLGLIFVAVYQSLLHLSWIDQLLDNVKTIFISLYRDQFKKPHTSVVECTFDGYFDRQIQALEQNAGAVTANGNDASSAGLSTPATDLTPPSSSGGDTNAEDLPPPLPGLRSPPTDPSRLAASDAESNTTSTENTPLATPDSSRPSTPSAQVITARRGPGGKPSRRDRKAVTSTPQSRDQSARKSKPQAKGGKQLRKWDDTGALDEAGDQVLDYSATSAPTPDNSTSVEAPQEFISQDSWSRKTGRGEVVLKDLDDEMASILSSSKSPSSTTPAPTGLANTALGAVTGLFRNVLGNKQLTPTDLQKPLAQMQNHLISKNVERTAAARLCSSVQSDLLDTRTASFQSIDAAIATSMEKALTKILTPTSSLDLLRSIAATISPSSSSTSTSTSNSKENPRPYVISVVGVNGVGKSTTLAKLAFLLLNNNYRVLVCGADTFRSGAVEQLRVHVTRLQELIRNSSAENPMGAIDLFERGYGKDPAHIARDAVAFASAAQSGAGEGRKFDVVLIDTAGRRHNDTRLMSSLEGFARLANPDKIFMVGEALVGSDAVAQARDFNAAFGPKRGLDGFIVSKCDTVGEMVGTIVSMVHATGVPVVAVGVGQHYGDLRTLNVGWARRLLMQ